MGFGHRVYKVKDPRATVLQELAEHVFAETSRPPKYEMAVELEKHVPPASTGRRASTRTSISIRGVVYQALGHPARPVHADLRHRPRRRLAGPLARAAENNRIFRPEQIYVGKHDVPYVPLEKRP